MLSSQLNIQLVPLLGYLIQLVGKVVKTRDKGGQQLMGLGQHQGFFDGSDGAISRVHLRTLSLLPDPA